MSIFNKWWFWAGAILAIYLFKNSGSGVGADIYGAAANARNTLTSFIAPGSTGSVETAAALQSKIDSALAPYKSVVDTLTSAAALSTISPGKTAEINDYTNQMVAITNAIKAGNPTI